MKRLVPSLVLMVVAAAAVAYLLLVERARPSDAERALRAQSVLPVFRPDELTRIALERPGDALVLVRSKGVWSVASPASGNVDTAAVEALVGSLASASTVRVASADTPPSALGEPRARLDLTFVAGGAGGVTTRASLVLRGPASTPAGAAYVARDDGSVVVASGELAAELLLPSDRFRDRVVTPYPLTRVSRFVETVTEAAARRLELSRSAPGTFRLADGRRASRATTDALAIALSDLRVETFLPAEAAAAITAAPSRTIELEPPDGEPRATLRFGAACPGHAEETTVAVDAPVPFAGCVTTSALAPLAPADDHLVEHHLFQAKVDEVSSFTLQTPGGLLDLARKGSGWHQRSPADRDLDPGEADAATTLLEALVAAQGTPHFLAPAPSLPAARVATLRAGDPPTDEALVWTPAGEGAETRELTLSPDVRELLEPTARSVKALTLWDPPLDPARVAAIDSITLGCAGHEQRLERRSDGWSLAAPVATMADQAGVIDLLDAVVHARARRWVEHASLPGAGCAGVALAAAGRSLGCLALLSASASAPEGPLVAVFQGPAAGPPSFARVEPALAERACRWYVDRHAFALPADVASVTVVRGGHRVGVLRPDAGDDGPSAFATLDGLVADDVVHPGAPGPDDRLDPPELEVEARAGSGAITRLRFGALLGPVDARVRRATVSGIPAVFALSAARLEPVFRAAAR